MPLRSQRARAVTRGAVRCSAWLGHGCIANALTNMVDGKGWSATMKHRMAIRADGTQVCNGIDAILATYLGKVEQVVDVNKALSELAASSAEIEIAHDASSAVVLDAKRSGGRIAFVGVNADLADGTLEKVTVAHHLLGVALRSVLKQS